ncbi:hypothetical protein [Geomesophilobacter sediminis]|uniref:Uncharacterized protein n=1 Tax=Geomesophilobacter sediminis TaxID=2798584 RepID=A0A8J7M2P0_9BACT|nr:hypothetical protein [Geomesophilobacter sediminis]MBJ6727203.1 hypothetical protein [Geomesophilobacter sediminis]
MASALSLDQVGKIGEEMGAAFLATLKKQAPDIESYAKGEGVKMAQCLATITSLFAAGTIQEEEAKLQLDIQKQAARAVLLTVEGLGALAVEAAINAALGVAKDAVNTALGIVLI